MQAERGRFQERLSTIDPTRLVFLDESGSHIAMTRAWARGPRGQRVRDAVPRNRGVVTTMLGALTLEGVRAMMTVEGATDTQVFDAFVGQVLLPTLKTGDVVVLDNLGAHRPPMILDRIRAVGAEVIFLPPYSPDLNPIEECWSKIKTFLRRTKARTRLALDSAIAAACSTVTTSDASGWFRHSGYVTQSN